MTTSIRRLAYCAVFVLAGGAGQQAAAQSTVLRTPEEVRACLCGQQGLAHQAGELTARRDAYEAKKKELDGLDSEVTTQRPQVNVNDTSAVAAFKALVDKRDAAQQSFAETDTPQYSAFVDRYNQRVANFNQSCGSKSYDAAALAQAQQGLSCPAE